MSDTSENDFHTITPNDALVILGQGQMVLDGLLPWGSNYTFLVYVTLDDITLPAVYKPTRGERPLWDFPTGTLAKRELAAYLTAASAGWNFIPPTVYRDGPHGPGSVQFFVNADPEAHYFNLPDDAKQALRPLVLFDIFTNNADRKSGHVLKDDNDTLWGIDHGLCFNHEPKLRTVIWDFAGQPIPGDLLDDMRELLSLICDSPDLRPALAQLLAPEEIRALEQRLERLIKRGSFPQPGPGRNYPWPPV